MQGYLRDMSIYGPPREQLEQVVSGLKTVEEVYDSHGLATFMQDNLVALMRNESFFTDTAFVTALVITHPPSLCRAAISESLGV